MKNVTELHSPDRAQRSEQLSLLPASDVPVRFQLSRSTRERGMRHVAEIREQIARQRADARTTRHHGLQPRHPEAA
jgi:hypothetical protein